MDLYQFDKLMLLADGAAQAVNGIGQVAAANKILDLGAVLPRTDLGIVGTLARMKTAIIIDVSAINVAAGSLYFIDVMGSNVAAGTNPVHLGGLKLGIGTSLPNGSAGLASTGAGSTSGVGRFIIFTDQTQADVNYEFLYLFNTFAGGSQNITYTAFASMFPPTQ